MAIPSKEQVIHDGEIDYLLRGCQRTIEGGFIERDVLPYPSSIFYRHDTHLHDLARFAHEISDNYSTINADKLIAGFSMGVFIVDKSDVAIRDFRIKTESLTNPNNDLAARIVSFEQLAYYDAIDELSGKYPNFENPNLRGKNYDLGVRTMLAVGYFVLTDTVEAMNAEDAKVWFRDAMSFYKNKQSEVVVPDHFKDWYIS